jgi:lipid-A-disaccharide synthase
VKIMLSCGEASGDLYAGALAEAVRRQAPSAELFGFGGERFRAGGGRLLGDYRGFAVTGLTEALKVLPRSWAMYRRLVRAARVERPDVFVAVDFPDFNFRLAAAVRALGIPVVYYISPQLWAWRAGRMKTMKRIADRVLVIFPFEQAIYERAGVPVDFVGHPLVDLAAAGEPREPFLRGLGLDPAAPTVALLPGSRPNEVRAILPGLAGAARLLVERVPGVQFLVARAPNLDTSLFDALGAPGGRRPAMVEGRTDDVLAASDLALTASGTATVQTALHEVPMVVVYRLSPLTYRLGKPFVRVDTYAMVNLVAGERVAPELIQDAFTPDAVAAEALGLLTDAERIARTRAALRRVRAALGAPGASDRAARAILDVAGQPASCGRAGRRPTGRVRISCSRAAARGKMDACRQRTVSGPARISRSTGRRISITVSRRSSGRAFPRSRACPTP